MLERGGRVGVFFPLTRVEYRLRGNAGAGAHDRVSVCAWPWDVDVDGVSREKVVLLRRVLKCIGHGVRAQGGGVLIVVPVIQRFSLFRGRLRIYGVS